MIIASRGKNIGEIFYIDIIFKFCWLGLITKLSEVSKNTIKKVTFSSYFMFECILKCFNYISSF